MILCEKVFEKEFYSRVCSHIESIEIFAILRENLHAKAKMELRIKNDKSMQNVLKKRDIGINLCYNVK